MLNRGLPFTKQYVASFRVWLNLPKVKAIMNGYRINHILPQHSGAHSNLSALISHNSLFDTSSFSQTALFILSVSFQAILALSGVPPLMLIVSCSISFESPQQQPRWEHAPPVTKGKIRDDIIKPHCPVLQLRSGTYHLHSPSVGHD